MADRVLVLGASARAAAASARRAGLDPFAIDLFADADTQRICDTLRCPPDEYPHGLFRLARQVPPMPWLYTGGLENYPELVGELAAERELWGNGREALAKVRGPVGLASTLAHRGFHFPGVALPGGLPTASKQWVRVPLKGSGGVGIRYAHAADLTRVADPNCEFCLKEYVPGRPMSVSFANGPDWCEVLGLTVQLVGEPWLHAEPFSYCGNILVTDQADPVYDLFVTFADAGRPDPAVLGGLWGLDFVRGPDRLYPLEINPRYPASLELTDLALDVSAVAWHEWSYGQRARPSFPRVDRPPTVGKAIYYAPHRLTVPAAGPWDESLAHAADVWRRPDFADIPHPGEVIDVGRPVVTIFAEADTEADCLARLQSRAADLDRLFGAAP